MRQKTTPLNLLDSLERTSGRPNGAPWWGKALVVLVAAAILGGGMFTFRLLGTVSKALSATMANTNAGFFQQVRELVAPPEKFLRGEEQDRINILLLGMGGEGHDGAYLTDTIIVASFQPSQRRAALFSIPRDLLVNIPGAGYRKINYANAMAELDRTPGDGAVFTSTVVGTVINAPIHYFVRVDFNGFEQLVDDVGGIDVVVDKEFTDREYPTADHGYQTIRFAAGQQHFDGATALKYVRSRHGSNGEGSDFARSRRQQKVLVAFKDKLFSFGTLLNPTAIANALTTLSTHVQTNFQPWELVKLAKAGTSVDPETVTTRVLDTTPQGLLTTETGIDNAYLLVPRDHTFSEIHEAFRTLLTEPGNAVVEHAVLEIENGTTAPGLAARKAQELAGDTTLTLLRIRNAKERNYTTTVIYDLTGGTKPATLAKLKDRFHAEISTSLPALLAPADGTLSVNDLGVSLTNSDTLRALQTSREYRGVDFVVVLGADQLSDLNPGRTTGRLPST